MVCARGPWWNQRIITVFQKIFTWPIQAGYPLKIKCANSQVDVQSLDPFLWGRCQRGAITQFYILRIIDITIIVCPDFWSLSEESDLQPWPKSCPQVRNNRFVENSRRITFAFSRATVMFMAAASRYGALNKDPGIGHHGPFRVLSWLTAKPMLAFKAAKMSTSYTRPA